MIMIMLVLSKLDDDKFIVNMYVWESTEDLELFVYKSRHADVLRRRKEWFSKIQFSMVMWYVPVGIMPVIEQAKSRLEYLEQYGSSLYAFDFRQKFAPPTENIIEQ